MDKITDLGKIGITLGGEYDNKVVYEKLTIVLYKGKSYISTKTTQGVSPEQDVKTWQLVAEAKDAYHMLVDAGKTTLTEEEFLKQLEDATKGRYIVQGNIVNAADEEDLTVEHSDLLGIDTLKLANRDNTNGMGYVILRKNKSFAEQVTKESTIYEIRYNFIIESNITIPANCVLKFDGGSIFGEYTLTFQNTYLSGKCNITCNVSGNVINDWVTPQMFGAKADGATNDTKAFQSCIEVSDNIYTPNGNYIITLQYRGKTVHNGILITRSNVHMKFEQNAVLQGVVDSSIPKPSGGYTGIDRYYGNVIRIQGDIDNFIENITIEGGVLIGVRSEFARSISAITDENQCAISFEQTKNTVIKDCVIKDNQGDSIIAYYNYNVLIKNIKSYDTRRTGISVGPCEGFIIDGCYFYDNGCDKQYGSLMNYGTAPNYAICLEGDITETSLLREFNGVVVKNCYAEYKKLESTTDVFIARNSPAFFLSGQLANGGDNIIIENNVIVNKNQNKSIYDINISNVNSKLNSVIIKNNIFRSLIESTTDASGYIIIMDSYLKNVEIIDNQYTNNQNFVWLYDSSATHATETVVIERNTSINIDNLTRSHGFLFSYISSINNIIVKNNIHNGLFITDYAEYPDLIKAEITCNTVKTNFGTMANKSFITFNSSPYSAIINIHNNNFEGSFSLTDGSPFYFIQGQYRMLDTNRKPTAVEGDAVYVETAIYNIKNNIIRAIGSNFNFSNLWSGLNGEIVNNRIVAPSIINMNNNLIPSEHLYFVNNICTKKIVSATLAKEIVTGNIYDNGDIDS